MIQTINGTSNRMPSFGVFGTTVPRATPSGKYAYIDSIQIMGFIPLTCVTEHSRLAAFTQCDCRDWSDDQCYINPVFAMSSGQTDPLRNDTSTFTLDYPFFYNHQWTNPALSAFSLERFVDGLWEGVSPLDDNTYGIFQRLGTMCVQNRTEIKVQWQKVIMLSGPGLYRIRVDNSIFGRGSTYVSEPFCLKEWSCKGADKTVRWDAKIQGGRVGSITNDQMVFNLCCENPAGQIWEDSVRVYAFFGREKTEYERENIEYQNGEVVKIRDEAIQKFEYETAALPKYLHDRFKAYGIMADELKVTDYNWNNSDYEIDQKRVVCEGSYEPEYHEDTRYSWVKVVFAEGFKNVIRDKCCVENFVPHKFVR